ncbi:ferrochelatase [Sphingobium sp. AP49]|uniref:ferrochelatase n=1 Tax=Sphingobium sp. AP49 TaxID=1144307 RepID=UPI00026EDF71|nr:ferrochelatase [Sphingobium sp. AP49]WHO38513.1 ferrochelatase [Sphingobium sp. AP49]
MLSVDHPVFPTGKVGVLLLNLGTPDAPDTRSVRRYLAQFLSDPRVVEIPRIVWQPILRGAILTTRPRKSAHAYQQVWMPDGSPLAVYTRDTAVALQQAMGQDVVVDWAMRYGNPAIADRLKEMQAQGCDRILLAPLYPQYSAATTATALDAAFAAMARMRWQPSIRTLPPYPEDPAYIEALAQSIAGHLARLDFAPDALLASFHGMPERTLRLGDPYYCHAVRTAERLGEVLPLPVHLSFQSRFGRARWLEPETEATLTRLVKEGVRNVAVVTPGFAADCLETLEEIALRAKAVFLAEGGEKFAFLPCLNASPEAITLYQRLVGRELAGWVDQRSKAGEDRACRE